MARYEHMKLILGVVFTIDYELLFLILLIVTCSPIDQDSPQTNLEQ